MDKTRVASLASLALYLAFSLLFFATAASWRQNYYGYTVDPIQFIWFLNWWPFAILHGLNPFICHYVWYPAGFNMSWATSVPLLALLMAPVTLLAGPVLAYNILILAAPALAAWTCFLLCRELTGDPAAALVGGFLFGFSSYEICSMSGDLNLAMTLLVPLAGLIAVRRIRGRGGRGVTVLSLAAVMLAQMLIATEILASLCVIGALAWAVFAAFAPPGRRAVWLHLAADVCLAAIIAGLLGAPFLYYLLVDGQLPAQINSPQLYSAYLYAFVFPTIPVWSGWSVPRQLAAAFTGFVPDKSTYLSLPLLLILGLYFRAAIARPWVKPLALTTGAIVLCSLGPVLHIGKTSTFLPLPWAAAVHLPLLRAALPIRLIIYVDLCAALATSLWLADAPPPARRRRNLLAALACLVLVPLRPVTLPHPWRPQPIFSDQSSLTWSPWPDQPFFTPGHIRQTLGPAPNVILLPLPVIGAGMAWQVNAGMGFTQSGGYVGFVPKDEQTQFPFLSPPGVDFATQLRAYCHSHHVDDLLLGSDAPQTARIASLHWPSYLDDGIEVVKVPK